MGLTVLELEVGNPADPGRTEKLDFLIDSGAIYLPWSLWDWLSTP